MPADSVVGTPECPRHSAFVRVTHWLTTIAFIALLVSGFELVVSHPRFYFGETGNSGIHAAFIIPIPSSRSTVPTSYKTILPDQNGWSRYLHFEAAWVLVLAGLLYIVYGLWTRHFRNDLLPASVDRNWRAIRSVLSGYRAKPVDDQTYNVVQRTSYLAVVFVLFPLMIWTGLAMSPAITSAAPWLATLVGGRQTARTIHFFDTGALSLFVILHVTMVIHAGFRTRMRAMLTGRLPVKEERI